MALPTSPVAVQSTDVASSDVAGNTISVGHTPAGGNRLLVASVAMPSSSVLSVTFAGLNFTLSQAGTYAELWYLVNPPLGAGTVLVTFNASVDNKLLVARTYANVDQRRPIRASAKAFGSSTTPVVSSGLSGRLHDLIIDAVGMSSATATSATPGSGQTERSDDVVTTGTNLLLFTSDKGGATGAGSMSWTADQTGVWDNVTFRVRSNPQVRAISGPNHNTFRVDSEKSPASIML